MQHYSAEAAPAPADWLALDPAARFDLVHAYVGVEPTGASARQAQFIVAAENLLAEQVPQASSLMDRLLAHGLDRRASLVALGSQVRGALHDVLTNQIEMEPETILGDLLLDGHQCLDGGLARAIRRLVSGGDFPPEGVQRALILHAGRDALPGLFELMHDRREWDLDSESMGWAPLNAMKLVAAIGDPASIEPVLDFVEAAFPEGVLDGATSMLEAFGPAIAGPAIARHDALEDVDLKLLMITLAAQADVEDRRIYDRLIAHLEDHPTYAASGLVLYRDDDAIPHLRERLSRLDPATQGHACDLVADGITLLGGELTADEAEKVEQARYAMAHASLQAAGREAPAPGGAPARGPQRSTPAERQKKKAARQMKKKSRPKKKK
ncbi:MAG: hypothetical protein R3F60_21825 [bacterium]